MDLYTMYINTKLWNKMGRMVVSALFVTVHRQCHFVKPAVKKLSLMKRHWFKGKIINSEERNG